MLRLLYHPVFAVLVESLAEWALKCPIDLLARHVLSYSLLKTATELIVAIISAVLTDIDFALVAVSWIS